MNTNGWIVHVFTAQTITISFLYYSSGVVVFYLHVGEVIVFCISFYWTGAQY